MDVETLIQVRAHFREVKRQAINSATDAPFAPFLVQTGKDAIGIILDRVISDISDMIDQALKEQKNV